MKDIFKVGNKAFASINNCIFFTALFVLSLYTFILESNFLLQCQ